MGPEDVLARLGGDELAVLLDGAGREQAQQTASAIIDSLAQPFELDELSVHSGASIGISLFTQLPSRHRDGLGSSGWCPDTFWLTSVLYPDAAVSPPHTATTCAPRYEPTAPQPPGQQMGNGVDQFTVRGRGGRGTLR